MPSGRPLRQRLARLGAFLRHPFSRAQRRSRRAIDREYLTWIERYDRLDDRDHAAIATHIARLADPPRIDVLMPVHDPPVTYLREAIASVTGQLYPHWRLCIADDASSDPEVRALLRGQSDPRIRLVERPSQDGISAASNSALAIADGDWIALLDHDDRLAPHALYLVAAEIAAHPGAAMIFSDEDAIDEQGLRFGPNFKPDWNEELMLGQNAFSHLGVFRAAEVRRLGGFRSDLDGSQDWDLALRVADAVGASRIRHIPHVLYHWRQSVRSRSPAQFSQRQGARALAAGEHAIRDHLARRGEGIGEVQPVGSWLQVAHPLPSPAPTVSVIMVAGAPRSSARAAGRLLAVTRYDRWQLLVVAGSDPDLRTWQAFAALAGDARFRLLLLADRAGPALLRNYAAGAVEGEVIVFLGEDVMSDDSDWLTVLVSQASRQGVGAAGGLVAGPGGRMADGGLLLATDAIATPVHRGLAADKRGYFGRAGLAQDLSAVSAACLATRRDLFRAAGGFDPALAVHGDVDYCLRLRRMGHRIVWTPLARMRWARRMRPEASEGERILMRTRWAEALAADPAGNPNLVPDGTFALAFPPRSRKPWRDGPPSDPL